MLLRLAMRHSLRTVRFTPGAGVSPVRSETSYGTIVIEKAFALFPSFDSTITFG